MHNRKQQSPNIANARPDPRGGAHGQTPQLFKAEKLRILAAADACVAPDGVGALLPRGGIYSSHLATWRKQRQLVGEAHLVAFPHTDASARDVSAVAGFNAETGGRRIRGAPQQR
jgi:hypothetical protein